MSKNKYSIKPRELESKSPSIKGRKQTNIDYDNEYPSFNLQHVSQEYGISECTKDEKISFVNKIFLLSKRTWRDIKTDPNPHGLGSETIKRESIRVTIPLDITEDVIFLAFRFNGKKPMLGYRKESIFYIIWFDRNFKVYDHGK